VVLFILACLITGLALLAVFRLERDNATVNGLLVAVASVVGLALLLTCRTWWRVSESVLHSQRKRLHSAANRLSTLKSEGFMKVRREMFHLLVETVTSRHVLQRRAIMSIVG